MTTFGKIGFIGGGNMGSCLVGGLIHQGTPNNSIWVAEQDPKTCQHLKETWGVTTSNQLQDIVGLVDILVLAVKPQNMRQVIEEVAKNIDLAKTLLISIAAGITTTQIQRWLKSTDCSIIRAMPNTPALLGAGITGLFATKQVSPSKLNQAEMLLKTVGETVWVKDESLMDVVTALSGSGPAYFFYVMEVMIKGATALGLPIEIASKLTLQTALGSAKMALNVGENEDIAQLREKVTSPGGTTEQGIKVLKDGKLEDLFANTLKMATARGKTLSEQYD